jgi:hypothetical protein
MRSITVVEGHAAPLLMAGAAVITNGATTAKIPGR